MTTFDPTRIDALLTLSNSNLTTTHTSAVTNDSITPGNSFNLTGQWIWTFNLGKTTATHGQLGMCSSATATAAGNFLGQNTANSFGLAAGSGACNGVNGGVPVAGLGFVSNDTVDCAVDLTGRNIWFRRNGGNWNASSTAVPGVSGGLSITSTSALTPACNCQAQNDAASIVFTPAFTLAGFSPWDPAPTSAVKSKTAYNTTEISQTINGSTVGSLINVEGLPYASVQIVNPTNDVTSVQPQGSNDGVTFVNMGSAVSSLPAIQVLYSASEVPPKYVQFAVNGGGSLSVVNINILLMGSRG